LTIFFQNCNFSILTKNAKGNVFTFPFFTTTLQTLSLIIIFIYDSSNAIASSQSATLTSGFNHLYFEEKSTTNINVKEYGFTPALIAAIENQDANQFSAASISLSSGKISYDGKTQAGTKTSSKSYATIADLNIKMGRWIQEDLAFKTGLSLGLGYRYWDRAIQSTSTASGLREKYTWNYISLGVHSYQFLQSKNDVQISVELIKPFNAIININHKDSFDSINLNMDPQLSLRLSGEWQTKYDSKKSIFLACKLEIWRMDKSNTRQLSVDGINTALSITEPANISLQSGLTVGVKWN